ncbi:MAG: hypothetical protein EOP56_14855 [Sphingobacteriales bacterium]|nr:MAG: hypothetical protein EOP56_14855 [Sphingobacteriales bacterium]
MKRNNSILLAAGLVFIGAASRIVNLEMSLFNLAPVAAIALFSGAVIKDKRLSFIVPLLSLLVADIYIELFSSIMSGFYGIQQLFVYMAMALITLVGTRMKNMEDSKPAAYTMNVLGFSLTSSALFFIVSNFGSFLYGMYGMDLNGLITTYVMAIPFYQKSFASDMIGSGLFFGAYYMVQKAMLARTQRA